MGLEDIIVLLIFIGLPILRWIFSRVRRDQQQAPEEGELRPESEPYRPKRDLSDPGREWEDLMEALGQPSEPTSPSDQRTETTPPPIPAEQRTLNTPGSRETLPRSPGRLPELSPEVQRLNQALADVTSKSRTANSASTFVSGKSNQPQLSTPVSSSNSRNRRLRSILSSPQSVRDAVLVNEILQSPVGLR